MLHETNYELITQIVLEVYKQLNEKKTSSEGFQKDIKEITYLSIGTMGRLANGNPINIEEEILFQKLIKGENVVVKEENIEFLNIIEKPNYELNNLLNRQLQILKKYGLVINKSENKLSEHCSRKLYTLEKIKALQLAKETIFYKEKEDIITPLAVDYLNRQHIKIEMR